MHKIDRGSRKSSLILRAKRLSRGDWTWHHLEPGGLAADGPVDSDGGTPGRWKGRMHGVYEIDPVGGALRALWRGAYPDCGGPVSPTSGCMLRSNAKQLDLVNLESGSVETLFKGRGGPTPIPAGVWSPNAVWSPDGRWISAIQDGRLVVIDANNTSKRRKLGRSDHPGVWSPDSKYLLFIKSQFSCLATLYFESLEVLEVESGRRSMIKSAHCNVGGGMAVGWIDRSVIH